ncbi:Thermophilic serine proteinase precursor [Caballeronia pedi]|uniref:Thermophilic serine proteinase n=2 Tax=Caballeronia pedi TaxID=1777141 RepID=A0A158E5U4_9BURK|nr:Thermophilic serine proteinase precursor [Caballeronia pedi]
MNTHRLRKHAGRNFSASTRLLMLIAEPVQAPRVIVDPDTQSEFEVEAIPARQIEVFTHVDSSGVQVNFRHSEVIMASRDSSSTALAILCIEYKLTQMWFDRIGKFGLFRILEDDLPTVLKKMEDDDRVLFAEPNILDGGELNTYQDTESEGQPIPTAPLWNHQTVCRQNGWSVDDGGGVVIAIVDTPVFLAHPGLKQALFTQTNEFHFGSTVPEPQNHGTSVASILVDSTSVGGAPLGLAPGAKLLPVSIDTTSDSSYARRAVAINFLARALQDQYVGLRSGERFPIRRLVVNCSWQLQANQDLTSVSMAFDSLNRAGAVCVCSAGNTNQDGSHYPSDYAGCISIAGVTKDKTKSPTSNFGKRIDFALPGGNGSPYDLNDIFAAQANGAFDYVSGTSFAAPHAGAVLATIWSRNRGMMRDEILRVAREACSESVDKENPDFAEKLGRGILHFP